MVSDILGEIPRARSRIDPKYLDAIEKLYQKIVLCYPDAHVIVFSSIWADEGKSTVTEEIAYRFARNGKKVLAIDADPHNTSLFGHLPGLTEYMNGDIGLGDFLSDAGRVDFLCSGQNQQKMYFDEEKAEALVSAASEKYDYILIDTPPLHFFRVALTFGKFSDGIILVRSRPVRDEMFERMVSNAIGDTAILGTVRNNAGRKIKNAHRVCA